MVDLGQPAPEDVIVWGNGRPKSGEPPPPPPPTAEQIAEREAQHAKFMARERVRDRIRNARLRSPADVRRCVGLLAEMAEDDSEAHALEDDMRCRVLEAIASGDVWQDDAIAMAREVLKTADIDFARWTS